MALGALFGSEPSTKTQRLPLVTPQQRFGQQDLTAELQDLFNIGRRGLGRNDPAAPLLGQEENTIENLQKIFDLNVGGKPGAEFGDLRSKISAFDPRDLLLENEVPAADFLELLSSVSSLQSLSEGSSQALLELLSFQSPDPATDTAGIAQVAADSLIELLTQGPIEFEEFFQQNVVNPGTESFRRDVIPAIQAAFSGEASFGGERREAANRAGENLSDELIKARSALALEIEKLDRETVLAGLSVSPEVQALQGFDFENALRAALAEAGVKSDAAKAGLSGIELLSEIEFAAFDRELAAFQADQSRRNATVLAELQKLAQLAGATEAEAQLGLAGDQLALSAALGTSPIARGARTAEQGESTVFLNALIQLLTQQQDENVVTVEQGSSGLLGGILGGAAQGATSALLS